MKIFLTFDIYVDSDDFAGQDEAIGLTRVESPNDKLYEIFKTGIVFETAERDFDRLLRFIKHSFRNKQSVRGIYAANEDYTVQNRRIYNLYTEQPAEIRPGDHILLAYFWNTDTQLLKQSYEIMGRRIYLLACGCPDNGFSVRLCSLYTNPQDDAHTRREAIIRGHRQESDSPFGYMPNRAVADGREIELNSRRMFYCGIEGQDEYGPLLYEYLKQSDRLPEELFDKSLAFVDCSSDALREQVRLPVQSLAFGFNETKEHIFVRKPFTAAVGMQDEKIDYGYSETGGELYFYMEGLRLIDVLKEVKDADRLEQFEKLCPRDRRLLVLAYENPYPEYSPMFYTKEYLDSPLRPSRESRSSQWLCIPKETGPHGLPLRYASFNTVDAHFSGELELELLYTIVTRPAHENVHIF
jgi:hypothetical protein